MVLNNLQLPMKNTRYLLSLAITFFSMAGCERNKNIPYSSEEKIDNLLHQAETESMDILPIITLSEPEISVENLSLSADYLVKEENFTGRISYDLSDEWDAECVEQIIENKGFTCCLKKLKITKNQYEELCATMRIYHSNQIPLLKNEFESLQSLNDSTSAKIQSAIDSMQAKAYTKDQFLNAIDQLRKTYKEQLITQRIASKNLSRLSIQYRNILNKIRSILDEKQFSSFYRCHKK